MKRILKFVFALFIYLQSIQLVLLTIARLPILISSPLGYFLIIGMNTIYLWFFSFVYRFRLSDEKDLEKLFWRYAYKISQFIGIKPESKLFLYYFIFTMVRIAFADYFKILSNPFYEDFFNITGLIALVFFIGSRNKPVKKD